MKLTSKGRYAVMAMADLAKNNVNKPTSLSESNYTELANGEGKPGIYILYSLPDNGVSFNATPVRRIFCRPKPFCKL